MNVKAILVGLLALAVVTLSWYILQPLGYSVIKESEDMIISFGSNTTGGANTYSVLYVLNDIWGPILAIAVIGFILIVCQEKDWRSANV